jgi:hypothetical protein
VPTDVVVHKGGNLIRLPERTGHILYILLKLGLETTMPWEVNNAVKQRWEFVRE